MIAKDIIIEKVVSFAEAQFNSAVTKVPIMIFARPIYARAINKYVGKFDKFLSAIADDNNMVDIEGILSEEIDNLLVLKTQKFDNFTIGEGNIKFNIPYVNGEFVITSDDIEEFKRSLETYNK